MVNPRGLRLGLLIGAVALAAAVSIVVLVAMRIGVIPSSPRLFAAAAAGVLLLAAIALLAALRKRSLPAALFAAGLLLVYGGGMANYLFSLQGYTILTEFEAIRLADGKALQAFDAGPLSNVREMELTLQLEQLALIAAGDGFIPQSRIRLVRKGTPAHVVDVSQNRGATDGTLRFVQGAFGFAPRIVVTRNGETVFDRYIPFTTSRVGIDGVSFSETFEIGSERMTVSGAIDLGALDPAMQGHARIGLAVSRDGRPLGRGELSMGHFAKLADGTYIGYAGLKRWSEIDISRRNYPQPIFAGGALLVLSVVAWPFTRRNR